jgi:hypothetical protein
VGVAQLKVTYDGVANPAYVDLKPGGTARLAADP